MPTGAAPIKLGFLLDYAFSGRERQAASAEPMELVFKQGLQSGMIDRAIEIVYRGVQGLPRGDVKAVAVARRLDPDGKQLGKFLKSCVMNAEGGIV